MSNMQNNKYILQFTMYGGGYVNFACKNMEAVKIHVNKFLEGISKMQGTELEAMLFADDDFGNHIGMIRCKHCVGYSLIDVSRDKSQELVESHKKMADAVTKSLEDGEDWKKDA